MKTSKLVLWILFGSLMGLIVYCFIPERKLPDDANVDSIIVLKSKRKLQVYSNGQLLKTYKISLGRNPKGDKQFQGDNGIPEGIYFIKEKNSNSGYYKNLWISYPIKEDIEHAQKLGRSAGGDIKIHGIKNGYGFIGKFHRLIDWTRECIALTNNEVDELYDAVKKGTKIDIRP